MRRFRFAFLLALSTMLLGACGNKGPLVMPDQKPASTPDQSKPETSATPSSGGSARPAS